MGAAFAVEWRIETLRISGGRTPFQRVGVRTVSATREPELTFDKYNPRLPNDE